MYNKTLATFLANKSILSPDDLSEILNNADTNNLSILEELFKNKKIDERDLAVALAEFIGIEYKMINISEIDIDVFDKFNREMILEHKILPYKEDETTLYFVLANPFRIEEINKFKFLSDKKFVYYITEREQIDLLIRYADNKVQQHDALTDFSTTDALTEIKNNTGGEILIDAPIIKLCDSILKDAINRGASDIHIEPFEQQVYIRFRIDGKLQVIDTVQTSYYQSILARYKIMSEMNIAERRVPQDGKMNLEIAGSKYDFRVSTIPTLFGEKIVIRIHDISLKSSSIHTIGLNDEYEKVVLDMIHRPHGIILMTGPTGSGKSTSLYTFLRYLNKEDVNIITVEDPVENQIERVNQVQVNPKANLTFANALRSILRQDPNIIMIGEIRDEETAQIATRAAITGHLVLSTIHTNDAAGVVSRLINMGVQPYLVADSLLGSISQRLVRRLCPDCKKPYITTPAEMAALGLKEPTTIYKAHGCASCNHMGYSGRLAVFEILVCDDEIRNSIVNEHFTSEHLNKISKLRPLLEDCKDHVLKGDTSMEEYNDLSDFVKRTQHN